MDPALYDQLFQNARRLWFDPEIERRMQAGQMRPDAKVWGAQVLMEVGQPIKVNLNEEVRGVFSIKPTEDQPALIPGQTLTLEMLANFQIRGMTLTQAEANCGHLTVMLLGGGYFLGFDFRYNAGRIEQLLLRAQEFISVATSALRRKAVLRFC